MKTQILDRLNKLTNWQSAFTLTILGFVIYFDSLKNRFLGDDNGQIVGNPVVHSISHLKLLFEGGTFYVGKGMVPLDGVYYRPLMMTVFSFIYTIFGSHPFYFHVIQLLICIGSTILLYLFFRYPFKPVLSLFLALIFLVHPIDSQTIFAIASMQDALFFFFGILALYLLVRFKSNMSLACAALCLLLALFAKETAVLFVIMATIYLIWFDSKRRAFKFAMTMILPICLYLILKTQAIGFLGRNPQNVPIDFVGLGGRLLTAPSIILFYFEKVIFPYKLASSYYWVHANFSIEYFILPLLIDLLILAVIVFLALVIKACGTQSEFYTYLFFTIWMVLGLVIHLQVIPLDMTATFPWFYFSMAGLLGMLGTIWNVLQPRIRPDWLLAALAVVVVGVMGLRTIAWGTDWSNSYKIANADIQSSSDNFASYNLVATHYIQQRNFKLAQYYTQKSIAKFPSFTSYNNLGLSLAGQGKYAMADKAYVKGLTYGQFYQIYEGIGELTLVYGNPTNDRQFLISALNKYPADSSLWLCLAIIDSQQNNANEATYAINKAAEYGTVQQTLYDSIINKQHLVLYLTTLHGTTQVW